MQKEITSRGPVLRPDGSPNPGYSTEELLTYRRSDIRANPMRIKEWDFYQIEDTEGRFCLQLTYGHASYIGQIGVMLFDIREKRFLVKESALIPLPLKRMRLPESASEDSSISWQDKSKGIKLRFECREGVRYLAFSCRTFSTYLVLTPQIREKLVISIPFRENPHDFYYNYKQNCMKADGFIHFSDNGKKRRIRLGDGIGEVPAFGLLDWGRGVWPYDTEWYWSNGCGVVDDSLLGFNLGCGFGDTSAATENIIFYGGTAHKLGNVAFHHGKDPMEPWTLTDDEGRLELTMTPDYDRVTRDKFLFVDNCTHQVFGRFDGTIVLDDESAVIVSGLPAFAEHAVNHW